MKTSLLFALTLAISAIATFSRADDDAPPQDDPLASGRTVFAQNCSKCHFVPDPEIHRDRVWTELMKTTA